MTHKCSPCSKVFKTEQEYLDHKCEKADGAKPGTVEFLKRTTTPNFDAISAKAKQRGAEKKVKKDK